VGERKGEGAAAVVKGVKELFAPTLPAVYIENFKYPETPASPETEHKEVQKNLI